MYNNQTAYKQKLLPLIKQLEKECYKANIPFFMTFAVEDDEIKTTYESEIYDENAAGIKLSQSYINKMACVLNGFVLVPNSNFLPDDSIPTEENIGEGYFS